RFSRDWSSDVCSSDLVLQRVEALHLVIEGTAKQADQDDALSGDKIPAVHARPVDAERQQRAAVGAGRTTLLQPRADLRLENNERSEERRAGKECRAAW